MKTLKAKLRIFAGLAGLACLVSLVNLAGCSKQDNKKAAGWLPAADEC